MCISALFGPTTAIVAPVLPQNPAFDRNDALGACFDVLGLCRSVFSTPFVRSLVFVPRRTAGAT